ncbi:unnamed protein product [Acanthoscelides obtectus]|uniref:DUF3730 domain-containing protein n=1 Tax=Acanthoscelides obtectus TaxID=200917 RepID=A0A9P0K1I4_ACAOB|nr:unnamed protein product [Acanthoscelides obtectus]CAK1657029.1 Focadhesin [Acanthoscelides obtectus]
MKKIMTLLQTYYRKLDMLHRPVFLYCICNPHLNASLTLCNQKLWKFLQTEGTNEDFLYNIISWMQMKTVQSLESTNDLISESLISKTKLNSEILILWQLSMLHYMALYRYDLRQTISSIKMALLKTEDIKTQNCQLLMLARTVDICSSVYLYDILDLCKFLVVEKHVSDEYALQTLNASLIQWMTNPCLLIQDALKVAEAIFSFHHTEEKLFDNTRLLSFIEDNHMILRSNSDVYILLHLCDISHRLRNEKTLLDFLENLEHTPCSLQKHIFNFLCGLFLVETFSSKIQQKIFTTIQKYVQKNIALTTKLLTLVLYKLSQAKDPTIHYELLKALPKLVVLRENIPKVIATLKALSKGSADLFNFCLSLMYQAWKIDNKCYPQLESMLTQGCFPEKRGEFYITKTYVLKGLCEKKPELYGKDMVAHISKILNECSDESGSLPCALALEGIKILCRAEVIDIITTWATLAPKFRNDKRILVVKAVCSLIEEIVHLSYTAQYTELYKDVVKQLWDYIELGNPGISGVALKSLGAFSLEHISAYMPEKYLDEDEQRGSRTVQFLVPGRSWIQFLSERFCSEESIKFVIQLISAEIDSYLKYVYQVKGPKEPINYGYLPTHSIVRGIGEFVKVWSNKWKNTTQEKLYIECLRILAQEYSKPLPPLDWCFLQERMHDESVKYHCVDIASHQVVLSGTSRRLMENYIQAVKENPKEDDILSIFRNLKHLANSIQPIIMKPFFEIAFRYAIEAFENDNKDILERMLKYALDIMQRKDIQDSNKVTIAQVLCDKIPSMGSNSELFKTLLPLIIVLPKKCLEQIVSLESDISEEHLQKIVIIRCALAMDSTEPQLNWLNDIIEVTSASDFEERGKNLFFIMNQFKKVFRKHINNAADCGLWLLDLIGRIQAKVADRCDDVEMHCYFNILILTIVELSGFHVFVRSDNTEKNLFPQAFASLLDDDEWSVCTSQTLEWLYHMNTEEYIPKTYREMFGATLQALRHDDEFMKHQKWMKYMSCNYQYSQI